MKKGKFKIGDKVVLPDGNTWIGKVPYRTIERYGNARGQRGYYLDGGCAIWFDDELELYVDPNECIKKDVLTIEEIILLKDDIVYRNINSTDNVKSVQSLKDGSLRIEYANTHWNAIRFKSGAKFKAPEETVQVKICYIEHTKNGKLYDFIEDKSSFVRDGDLVVCNTRYGNSYGRCIKTELLNIPTHKVEEYKTCYMVE